MESKSILAQNKLHFNQVFSISDMPEDWVQVDDAMLVLFLYGI